MTACFGLLLFHKYQVNSTNDEQERQNVIPMKVLSLKKNVGDDGEDRQTDTLLYYLELH